MDRMKPEIKKLNITTILGNVFLLIFKLAIGIISNSIAVISDAINSAIDCAISIITYICMTVGAKHPDKSHPFGHHRAEPIAAMLVAILTVVIGVEIIHKSFSRLFDSEIIHISAYLAAIYLTVIIVKGFLLVYTNNVLKTNKSEALKAMAVDHRNDMLISATIIISFFIAMAGYPIIDPIIGILLALYIIKTGVDIGLNNIKYLMGESPPKQLLETIKKRGMSIKGVKGIHDVHAHYIGLVLHVEVHIELDKNLKLQQAHDIGKQVQAAVQALEDVERAFVHIDPL